MATRSAWRRALGLLAATSLVVAACGSDDDDTTVETTDTSGDDGAPGDTPGDSVDDDASEPAVGSDDSAPGPSGEAVIGYVDTVDTLNPFPQGSGSLQFRLNLYEPLIAIDDAGEPAPRLAESWDFADDGTSLTLNLREDVSFHDGTPFDADVAVQNIELWKDPATNVQGNNVWVLVTATATDSSTVEMTFERPLPEIFAVMNTAVVTKPGDLNSGIGTGPFVLESYRPREGIVLTANPDYWDDGRPKVATLDLREFGDTAAASLAAQAGGIDILLGVQPNQVADIERAGLTVMQQPQGVAYDILVNADLVPDERVRRALNMAFDRERFVETVALGYATVQTSIYPPSSPVWANEDASSLVEFDLDGARALLDAAGVNALDLTIMSPTILPLEQFMPIYQADLATIGVNLTIEPVDPATWGGAVSQPGAIPDLSTHAYAFADLDPALIFSAHPFRVGSNASAFESDEYAQLVSDASAIVDTEERYAAFQEVDRFISEQSFVFPVANPLALASVAEGVVGLGIERAGFDYSMVTVSE